VGEPIASVEELLAQARLQGVEPDTAELATVREFLAVFLPGIDELSAMLPPGPTPAGPSPLSSK
jgi:hypothetical protein